MEILSISRGELMEFVKNYWKYLLGLAMLLALLCFGHKEYQDWKQHIQQQAKVKPAADPIIFPPQIINTKTEAGADPSLVSQNNKTAFQYAIDSNSTVMINLLLPVLQNRFKYQPPY